jgi:tryptophan halogenase
MLDTLRQIGISERTFLSFCDANFKHGAKFVGWLDGESDHYYHPFMAPVGCGSVNLAKH